MNEQSTAKSFADEWVNTSASGDAWDENSGPIEGVYLGRRENVGPNSSNVFTLKTKDGEVGVWGSTVINTKFSQIPLQSLVRVKFLGKVKSKGGKEYKDYEIQFKPSLNPVHQAQAAFGGGEEVPAKNYDQAKTNDINLDEIPF